MANTARFRIERASNGSLLVSSEYFSSLEDVNVLVFRLKESKYRYLESLKGSAKSPAHIGKLLRNGPKRARFMGVISIYWRRLVSAGFSEMKSKLKKLMTRTSQVLEFFQMTGAGYTASSQREIFDSIESMSDAFFAIDKNWKIIRINAHFEKVIGAKREDVVGKDLRELYFNDGKYDESKYIKSYRKAMDERVFVHFEDFYEPLNLWTEVRVYPKSDGGLAIFFTDIRDRIENDHRLAVERKKLEGIFYGADSPMVLFRGPNLIYEMANRKYLEMISFRDVIGKSLAEAMPEISQSEFPRKIKQVYDTGESVRFLEGRTPVLNTLTGQLEERFFDTTFARISDGPKNDYLVIGNAMDVTERVLSKKRLEKANAQIEREVIQADRERSKFEAAFHAVAEGIFIFDSEGNPVFMNDAAAKVFGSESAADVRKRVEYYFERLDLYDLDDQLLPLSEWPVARALRGESFREWQIKAHRRDTGDRWVWSSSGELARQSGTDVTLAVVVLRDITEQKKSEIELQNAKIEAEKANQLKSAFLANMSHEIRTPLGAMLGFSDLLKDPNLSNSDRADYLDVLTRNGEQLSIIINDILDLSKVEAGHLTLEYGEVAPDQICSEVMSLLNMKAKEKNLRLEYVQENSMPLSLVTDPTRLRQILLNLVGNAIKFTHVGSITLKSYGEKKERGISTLCLEVTDTGIGIPQAHKDQLFEMFVQADGSMTRRFGGTGLGLALSKRLANELGGDVFILQSVEGKGTTFKIVIEDHPERLTRKLTEKKLIEQNFPEITENMLKDLEILVVDDSADNRQLLAHLLGKQGARVESAENGLVGYKKALAGNYDVVLMDIQMPEMDGYTATQRLRFLGYTKPIVALTAHAMADVSKKCLEVGCTDHLSKPLNPRSLLGTVTRLTSQARLEN